MNILVCGAGSIGTRHIKNILSLGHSVVIFSRSYLGIKNTTVFRSLKEALDLPIDLAIICTPTSTHVEVAQEILFHKIPVLIEKPISNSWDGVENLLKNSNKTKTFMGFDLRFDPGLQKAKFLVDSGVLGDLISVNASVGQYLPLWHPSEDYRKSVMSSLSSGGGVLLDLVHELDIVMFFCGIPSFVCCFGGKLSSLQIETEDIAEIILDFNGIVSNIHLDYLQQPMNRSFRFICNKGTVVWDYAKQSVEWTENKKEHYWEYKEFTRNDRFLQEIKQVISCVDNKVIAPLPDIFWGAEVLKIALLLKRSMSSMKVLSYEDF